MFEYQTAICELTGMDVSNASVYEGPSALAAAGYLAKLANGRDALRRSRAACTRTRARRCATLSAGYGTRSTRSGCATASPTPTAWAEAIDDDVERRVRRAAELPRRGRGPRAAGRRRARARRARRRAAPTRSRSGSSSRRASCGVDVVRRRGPDARQPARLRRPVVRLLRRARPSTCGGCRGGSPARRATSTGGAASC